MKARCRTDRELFALTFFGDKLNYSFSDFHLAALQTPKTAYSERVPMSGYRRAIMGPRGNGKTTIYIRVEVLHDICYELERFIVILCEGFPLSKSRLREIRNEIERNPLIREFFGDLKGEIWQAVDIETTNGIRVLAGSMSGQVRGILHPETGARPTKIILDDAEDSNDALNPELRERDRRRFQQDIEGAAATDGRTHFQFTGTPLHREALLPSLEQNPGWRFMRFPAIQQWPARMDLWAKCREIWASSGDVEEPDEATSLADRLEAERVAEERVQLAHAYYRANRKKMDAGAKILWPDGEPLFQLMTWWWTNGEAAFSKEKQLVPRDPSLATFEMESDEYPRRGALRHTIEGHTMVVDQRDGTQRKVPLSRLRFIGFHDPAKADPKARRGRRKIAQGDYAAIPIMGVEELKGGGLVGHVVDCWLKREPVSKQVEAAFDLCEFWGVQHFILEEDTLALLRKAYRDAQKVRRSENRYWEIPLSALTHQTVNKDARISSMEPAVVNGWMTFNRTLPRVYWNQMVDHPTGDHDDGPDGTEACWRFRGRKRSGLQTVALH